MNPGNRFGVVQLHYTADKDKDPTTKAGRIWLDDAQRGISPEGFRREYEIDWASGAGKPVYPDFNRRQTEKLKWMPEFIIHRGWDRGFYHPACTWSCLDNINPPRWLWLYEKLGLDIGIRDFIAECLSITLAKFPDALVIDWFPPDTKAPSDMAHKEDERTPLAVAQNEFGLSPQIVTVGLKDRVNIIRRRMLLRADTNYGLMVDSENCPISIEGLEGGYHRNPKEERGDEMVKDGYYDHVMDAWSHTAAGIFNLLGEPTFSNYADRQEEVYAEEVRDPVTGFIQ